MPRRREQCDEFFKKIDVTPTYIDPVIADELNLPALERAGVVAPEIEWTRRAPIRTAEHRFEVACALSHIRALMAIVASGACVGFVFEDDNVVRDDCVERFHKLRKWAAKNSDAFYVVNVSPCNSLHLPVGKSTTRLMSRNQGCTNALMVSRKGAQALLRCYAPVRMPIDDWLHSQPVSQCVHPRIFEQRDATEPLTVFSAVIPFIRKLEYVCCEHVVFVFSASFVCIVLLFL